MLISSTSRRKLRASDDAELAGAGHERADVLGQAAAAEADAGAQELRRRCARRSRSPRASWVTSAPVASHTSAIALMNEILVARKVLAATLTSSAVGVVGDQERRAPLDHRGVDPAHDLLVAARRLAGPAGLATPITMRSGVRVSATAKPSRRNSGFQTRSTSAPAGRQGLQPRADVLRRSRPGTVDLPTTVHGPGQAGGQGVDRGVDLAEVGRVGARVLGGADADEVHVAELRGLGEVGGEPQPPGGDVATRAARTARARRTAPRRGRSGGDLRRRRRRRRARRSRTRPSRRRGWRRGSRCR